MKKKVIKYSIFMLLLVSLFTVEIVTAADQYPNRYTAYVTVRDQSSNGISGILVYFRVRYYCESLNCTTEDFRTGYTDSNGQVTIQFTLESIEGEGGQMHDDFTLIECRTEIYQVPNWAEVGSTGTISYMNKSISPFYTMGPDTDNNGVYDNWELSLAQKFSPTVVLNHFNQLFPAPVEAMFDKFSMCSGPNPSLPEVYYDTENSGGQTPQQAFAAHEYHWNSGWWLDFGSSEGQNRDGWYWHSYWNSIKANYTPTIYSHCFRYSPTSPNFVIQYWFYYPYNDWAGKHEGDWEHINVKVSSQNPDYASGLEAVYFFHHTRKTLSWSAINKNGNHPIVLVGGKAVKYVGGINTIGDTGWESGGSYPFAGYWPDVVDLGFWGNVSEELWPYYGTNTYDYYEFDIVNMTNTNNLWWMAFPGHWGVPKSLINVSFPLLNLDAPTSPRHHSGWELYHPSDRVEYPFTPTYW